jgi:hypothetical protein
MLPEVRNYLDDVRSHLHLDPVAEKRIISELYAYFQERIAELQENGTSEREAAREAIKSFGRARVVARLMYEAHSKGSWTEAVTTSLPHLILAGLFASHLWHHPILAPATFASIVGVTLFGWWHGKPNWLYSWIGYSLLPLLIAGYAYRFIAEQTVSFLFQGYGTPPNVLALLLFLAFCVFSLWIIIRTTIRVIRRDWILVSLMLVPLPIFASWLFNIEHVGGLFLGSGAVLYQWDAPMAIALGLLAVTSAVFIRLRQRVLKVGALVTIGSLSLAMVGHNLWGELGLLGLLTVSLCMLIFLLVPALAETKIGHGESKGEAWWSGDWLERPSTTR